MRRIVKTTEPVQPGSITIIDPEFIRVPDAFRLGGIKRGICYRLIKEGTIKSVLLRQPGNQQGVRLIHWPSLKTYLLTLMGEQDGSKTATLASRHTRRNGGTKAVDGQDQNKSSQEAV